MHKSAHLTRFCPACGVENQTRIIQSSTGADAPPPLERAAQIVEEHAERLKHTSHRDGLGMGWQAGEELCRDLSARLRAEQQEG
jgi:hypothetical protein